MSVTYMKLELLFFDENCFGIKRVTTILGVFQWRMGICFVLDIFSNTLSLASPWLYCIYSNLKRIHFSFKRN